MLGGGGDTNVSNKAENETNVDVTNNVANIIDVEALAQAVQAMGTTVGGAITSTAEQTKQLFTIGVLSNLVNAQAEEDKNIILEDGLKFLKLAGIAFAVWFFGRKLL